MENIRESILNLIKNNDSTFSDAFDYTLPDTTQVAKAEQLLNLKIPDSYLWFLTNFGGGGFFFDFLGYGLNGEALFANHTIYEREYGLPCELIVIETRGEYVVCINSQTEEIVSWSKHDTDGIIKMFDNFYLFFLDCIENAIDNYDE